MPPETRPQIRLRLLPLRIPEGAAVDMELPLPPPLNSYYRAFRGRVVLTDEGKRYKRTVADLAQGRTPLHGPVAVGLRIFAHDRDLDATFKGLFDALQRVCWLDDDQVRRLLYVDLYLDRSLPEEWVDVHVQGGRFCTSAEVEAHAAKLKSTREKTERTKRARQRFTKEQWQAMTAAQRRAAADSWAGASAAGVPYQQPASERPSALGRSVQDVLREQATSASYLPGRRPPR